MSVAKIDQFTISSENVSRNLETGETELTGKVQILFGEEHISADSARIDQRNKTASFAGNVVVKNMTVEVGGDQFDLNYENNTAVIINGYVKSNNIFFSGRRIEQRGKNQFFVVDADYTACSNCPATWSFDSSEIDAEIGGYAFLKNAFLRVSGIPVLWLPYFMVPLKNERQTGLLTPEFGSKSDRGVFFSQSLFLAVSRSQDLTFKLTNYERGGLKKQMEYNYALAKNSTGTLSFSHIPDRLFASQRRYTSFIPVSEIDSDYDRWSARGYAEHGFNESNKLRLTLNQVSDIQYPKDFYSDEFPNYADSALENRLNYTKNTDNTSFSINTIYYKHLLSANALSDNSMAVHQLPEIKYDTTLQQIGDSHVYYKLNFNYTNFHRDRDFDDVSIDGTQKYVSNLLNDPRCENDENKLSPNCQLTAGGVYDPDSDIIRTGQRFFARGTLLTPSYSIGDVVSITPEVSYNEAHYLFPVGDDPYSTKRYLEFDLVSRSKLYRIYESEDNKYKHEFIPEISYRWIPWLQEDIHPFFGTTINGEIPILSRQTISDNDINTDRKIQFDYNDRLYDRNFITVTLVNRVIQKNNETQAYANIFDFQLKQSYDIYQAFYGENKSQPLSALYSNANLYLSDFIVSNESYFYPYLSATNSYTTLTYKNIYQQYFKIGYISKRSEEPKQDDVSLALGFVSTYINVLTGVILDTSENRQADSRVKKVSMIAQIKPPGECWAINLLREQKIGTEAEWRFSFDFSWDGKPTKVIPPTELNIN